MSDSAELDAGDGEGSVRVLGTAHVSADSVEEVRETIDEERPDVVAVELDEGRYRQMQGEVAQDLEPSDLLEGNTVFQFIAYWMLSYVQAQMGDRFDIEPGADMQAAIEAAESVGSEVALVDRDIQLTIQRFWARMSFFEKLRMVWELCLAMVGIGEPEEDEEFDIEELTDGDVVTAMMEEFRQFSPGGAEALIDERDAFIAHRLVQLRDAGHDVLAVVGAGHRAGIEEYLDHPERLPPMEELVGTESGSRFSLFKIFGYLITVGFLGFFFLLFMAGVRDTFLLKVFAAWFLFNGVFAFGLAKLAGARWTSAGVGGAVAWLTSVNPLLAPGWFAGYVELRYTSVNVGDIAKLNDLMSDEETPLKDLLGQMLDVPLFRLIAIVAMTNVGSMIASFAFPFVVLPLLGSQVGGVDQITDWMIQGAQNSADLIVRTLT
ncbi:TraB/GumN family protein [Halorussus gelatinilyticus]|uniref:TraB/GumN family protein n=1 Tax=Halorussus gelatinilyticus TaxID=2937524 RepID=A0A8U0IIK9_9EURY|nr:TraB/GumN family protein [Halorussus gelatinilyticus]UPW00112.1 TraB/GumN family protein [Halorussus gelatinilyticus]